MAEVKETGRRYKTRVGRVVSNKMNQTVVIAIDRFGAHALQ